MIDIHKKLAVWGGTATAIVAIYTFIVMVLGINIRPVWAFELEQMNIQQKEFQREIYLDKQERLESKLLNIDLIIQQSQLTGVPVPQTIIDRRAETSIEIKSIEIDIDNLNEEILKSKGDK